MPGGQKLRPIAVAQPPACAAKLCSDRVGSRRTGSHAPERVELAEPFANPVPTGERLAHFLTLAGTLPLHARCAPAVGGAPSAFVASSMR